MISKIRKSFFTKVIALYLAGSFFLPAITGTMKASANSTGALASEFVANEGSDEFVDLFTGDFNYNIPLMTVPGPNGGYPINLSYNSSGVSMETEASWVGLGWNLNAGAIARNLNGIPDDFKGDEITYTTSMKELIRLEFNGLLGNTDSLTTKKNEWFGASIEKSFTENISLYFDNYSGVGFKLKVGPTYRSHDGIKNTKYNVNFGMGISYDSQQGYSFYENSGLSSKNMEISQSINSGRKNGLSSYQSISVINNFGFPGRRNNLHSIDLNTITKRYSIGFTYGKMDGTPTGDFYASLPFQFDVTRQTVDSRAIPRKSYGYLYSEFNDGSGEMDYEKQNEIPISKEIPNVAIPVSQPDDYIVSGPFSMGMRPFRNDIGIYSSPKHFEVNNSTSGSFEISDPQVTTSFHVGSGFNSTNSIVYSGLWSTGLPTNKFFQSKSTSNPLFEPYHFKSINEISTSDSDYLNSIGGENPTKVDVSFNEQYPNASSVLWINQFQTSQNSISKKNKREIRETVIQAITKAQEISNSNYSNRPNHIWPVNSYPSTSPQSGTKITPHTNSKDHHISKYNVIGSDGTSVEYGLPVYINYHVSANYSTDQRSKSNPDKYAPDYLCSSNSTESSTNNSAGNEHYFNETQYPAYTYAHLVTGIFGNDYVDLTGNGASEDDLGYYVKFNYSKAYSEFKWRTPYAESFQHAGFYSDENDDKASYEYGTKEIYYVNSIETKTHIAIFEIEQRKDSREPSNGQLNNAKRTHGGNQLYRLKKISLYAKQDLSKPLQTVVFNYSYDLCPEWTDSSTENGKLTLTSVTITNLENNKGESRPFVFNYNMTDYYGNPFKYNQGYTDRWGNLTNLSSSNSDYDWDAFENPYLHDGDYNRDHTSNNIDKEELNENCSAWLLSKITTPSNGELVVDYESDQYSYVQDSQAQSMFQIVGTSKTNANVPDELCPINRDYQRIYFKLKTPISSAASPSEKASEVFKYISGLDKVYFKTFQKLRKSLSHALISSYDYVNGYAKIETLPGTFGVANVFDLNGNHTVGFISVVSTPFIQRHKNRIYFSFYYNAVNCGKLVCMLCAFSFPQFTAFKNSIGDLSPRLSCGCSLL